MNDQGRMMLAVNDVTTFMEKMREQGFLALVIIQGYGRFSCSVSGSSVEKLGLVELAKIQIHEIVQRDAKAGNEPTG